MQRIYTPILTRLPITDSCKPSNPFVLFFAVCALLVGIISAVTLLTVSPLHAMHNPGNTSLSERQPAFPGAEGFGRYARGGRGGDVYYVTNLNDSGPGSLRYGIQSAEGPRNILFAVSGTIPLESRLEIDKPYLTIAGQTAPGDGITVRNHELRIAADHVVLRYIRSRPGDLNGIELDAIRIGSGSHIIIDHCSASWGIDETLSSSSHQVDSLTVQWCIISESLHDSAHGKGPHGMGGVIRAWRQTYHHNLFAHHNSRPPKIAWRHFIQADFRNNVIYNWGSLGPYDGSSAHANWVNNYYKPGPGTHPNVKDLIFRIDNKKEQREQSNIEELALFYINGNYVEGSPDVTGNNWLGVRFGGTPGFNEDINLTRTPFDYPPVAGETTAQEAYYDVLSQAGASLSRDATDRRIVEEVRSGSATYGYQDHLLAAGEGPHGIINSQVDVGGWPELRSTEAPPDSDGDGIPDWWEQKMGLNLHNPSDGPQDRNSDGYTNLEEYLHWLTLQ